MMQTFIDLIWDCSNVRQDEIDHLFRPDVPYYSTLRSCRWCPICMQSRVCSDILLVRPTLLYRKYSKLTTMGILLITFNEYLMNSKWYPKLQNLWTVKTRSVNRILRKVFRMVRSHWKLIVQVVTKLRCRTKIIKRWTFSLLTSSWIFQVIQAFL